MKEVATGLAVNGWERKKVCKLSKLVNYHHNCRLTQDPWQALNKIHWYLLPNLISQHGEYSHTWTFARHHTASHTSLHCLWCPSDILSSSDAARPFHTLSSPSWCVMMFRYEQLGERGSGIDEDSVSIVKYAMAVLIHTSIQFASFSFSVELLKVAISLYHCPHLINPIWFYYNDYQKSILICFISSWQAICSYILPTLLVFHHKFVAVQLKEPSMLGFSVESLLK